MDLAITSEVTKDPFGNYNIKFIARDRGNIIVEPFINETLTKVNNEQQDGGIYVHIKEDDTYLFSLNLLKYHGYTFHHYLNGTFVYTKWNGPRPNMIPAFATATIFR